MLTIKTNKAMALSQKERVLNATFIKAFIVAFLIHAFGLFLFSIKPLHFRGTAWIYPTIPVEADMTVLEESSIEADLSLKQKNRSFLLPEIPKPDIFLVADLFVPPFPIEQLSVSNPFDCFHHASLLQIEPPSYFIGNKNDFLTLAISGKLAEIPLKREVRLTESIHTDCELHYQVKMENETGKIIWFSLIEQQKVPESAKEIAERLLKEMLFTRSEGFITNGEISFTFQGEA